MSALLLLLAAATVLLGSAVFYFRRILFYGYAYLRMQLSVRWFVRRRRTVADTFARRVAATPSRAAVVFEGRTLSFLALDRLSARVAQWALDSGLRRRDVVGLLMDNRPEFIALWLGLAKVGVVAALVNTGLRGKALAHCLRSCDAAAFVVGAECMDAFRAVRGELPPDVPVWVHDERANSGGGGGGGGNGSSSGNSGVSRASLSEVAAPISPSGAHPHPPTSATLDLATALASYSDSVVASRDFTVHRAGLDSSDLLFLIFTSGTTGFPKAARIKHIRFQLTAAAFVNFFGLTSRDRFYCCLPLYHSAGGMIGVSCSWHLGATLVLRRKFSARSFFSDCAAERCTVAQYIGQLARYLLATPPSPHDRAHRVRMLLGNGMAAECWEPIRSRFGVGRIAEFYASTEGNANLVNHLNLPGVIGWIPPLARLLYPVRIVRFDPASERPLRDPLTGRCSECGPDEAGELLSRVDNADPLRRFDGYTSARASDEKVLRHVFRPGDSWFRSGDLVRADRAGLIRFVDRVGDTFRWKGENVATTEVAAVLAAFQPRQTSGHALAAATAAAPVALREANCYGVFVPGNEGRAGMASIVLARDETHPAYSPAQTNCRSAATGTGVRGARAVSAILNRSPSSSIAAVHLSHFILIFICLCPPAAAFAAVQLRCAGERIRLARPVRVSDERTGWAEPAATLRLLLCCGCDHGCAASATAASAPAISPLIDPCLCSSPSSSPPLQPPSLTPGSLSASLLRARAGGHGHDQHLQTKKGERATATR